MIFRVGTKEDLPKLKDAICRIPTLREDDLHSYLKENFKCLYVLDFQSEPIAFLSLTFEGEEAEIDDLAIVPSLEGKGYASYLLKQVENEIKKKHIQQIFLEVRKSNKKAISLYEKNGFSFYRIRKNYYLSPVEDALCYRKELFS